MTVKDIPSKAVDGTLKLVRFPADRLLAVAPESRVAHTAGLAVERADAAVPKRRRRACSATRTCARTPIGAARRPRSEAAHSGCAPRPRPASTTPSAYRGGSRGGRGPPQEGRPGSDAGEGAGESAARSRRRLKRNGQPKSGRKPRRRKQRRPRRRSSSAPSPSAWSSWRRNQRHSMSRRGLFVPPKKLAASRAPRRRRRRAARTTRARRTQPTGRAEPPISAQLQQGRSAALR